MKETLPYSTWDTDAPIKVDKKSRTASVYLTGKIEEPHHYNRLHHTLVTLPGDYAVNMHVSSLGGILDSAIFIAEGMSTCKAPIHVHLYGTVASAATYITMFADSVTVADNVSFMIHNYSAQVTGKGNEIKDRHDFDKKYMKTLFDRAYSGFLTTRELRRVIKGKDEYFTSSQVLERFDKRLKYLGKQQPSKPAPEPNFVDGIVNFNVSRNLNQFVATKEAAMLLSEMKEFQHAEEDAFIALKNLTKSDEEFQAVVEHNEVDALADICVVAMGAMHKKGYDIPTVMDEATKEINSRVGSLNTETGKWEKDVNQDSSTLYKADYTKAKTPK